MSNIDIYEQTTADTCLPACLIMALQRKGLAKPSQKLEIAILIGGDKLSKENRTFGHLAYTCKKFSLASYYYSSADCSIKSAMGMMKKMKLENIIIRKKEINSELVERSLKLGSVIVSIDDYALREELHFPHFVFVEKHKEGKFVLLDPWVGKKFLFNNEKLNHAISLLDKLLFWKEILVL